MKYDMHIIQQLQPKQMQNQLKLGRPVSGSKPRRHITKTTYNNPSLISNSVTALFKYPVVPSNENSRATAVNNNNFNNGNSKYADSLSRAEQQFLLRKDQQLPISKQQNDIRPQIKLEGQHSSPRMPIERRFSSPLIQQSIIADSKYNYLNHQSIKHKQAHGYNIINCYPSGQ